MGAIGDDGPGGRIEFLNCTVENTENGGAYVYDKSATAAEVRFTNCKWNNVATVRRHQKHGAPILISLGREIITKKQGGIVFEDCVVFDPYNRPALKTEEDQGEKGAIGIRGRILRQGPGEARTEITPESADCSMEITPL